MMELLVGHTLVSQKSKEIPGIPQCITRSVITQSSCTYHKHTVNFVLEPTTELEAKEN